MLNTLSLKSRLLALGIYQTLALAACLVIGLVQPAWSQTVLLALAGNLALGLLLAGLVARRLLARLGETRVILQSLSEGESNLVTRIPVGVRDEIGQSNRSTNIFIAKIHNIILKLRNVVATSNRISEQLSEGVDDVSSAAIQVTASMEAIQRNSGILRENIDQASTAVKDIKSSIDTIAQGIEGQTSFITEFSATIGQWVENISSIDQETQASHTVVKQLSETSAGVENDIAIELETIARIAQSANLITEVLATIKGIADSVSILAMNAAIEAANAGDYGKGFSVVADEIGKLADNTYQNISEIGSTMTEIVANIQSAETLSNRTSESIRQMAKGIQQTAQGFEQIGKRVSEMATGSQEIQEAIVSLVDNSEQIRSSSQIIEGKSDSIVDSMATVADFTHQTTQSIDEITTALADVTKHIVTLQELGSQNAEMISVIDGSVVKFTIIDTSTLKSSDGQDLVQWNKQKKTIPPRPADPEKYPEDDERRWYDMEWAGWAVKKLPQPESPADGAMGKKVVHIAWNANNYWKAKMLGMQKIAKAFGIELTQLLPGEENLNQTQLVDRALKLKPDLIILTSGDKASEDANMARIYAAGIPLVASTFIPSNTGFPYVLCQCGADHWGQFRLLSRRFADLAGKEGGYCIIQHIPGRAVFYSRTYAVMSELKKVAPRLQLLDKQHTNFDAQLTEDTVLAWIQRFGQQLKGLVVADDGDIMGAVDKALSAAGPNDIVVVSAGNCKAGMEKVKSGRIQAMTYQSAESDGALAIEAAIDFFNGMELDPIRYLPMKLIDRDNIDQFYPGQW